MSEPFVLSLIAAMSENHVIGRDGQLPWHLPADLKWFVQKTRGKTVIMGRRTYESVGFPLPKRRNIVVTTQEDWRANGVESAASLEAAIALAKGDGEVFIVGGERLYRDSLLLADRLYLTRVHATVEGDTRFPQFDRAQWTLIEESHHPADADHAYPMTFQIWTANAQH